MCVSEREFFVLKWKMKKIKKNEAKKQAVKFVGLEHSRKHSVRKKKIFFWKNCEFLRKKN